MSNTFWILIAYFAISAIGGAIARRQKQARTAPRPEPNPQPRPDDVSPWDPMHDASSGRVDDRKAKPRSAPPAARTPDDIAAEIRRVMGLEERESKVEVLEEVYEPPIRSAPPPIPVQIVPDKEPGHGGNLHDRMEALDQSRASARTAAGNQPRNRIAARYDQEREGSLRSRMKGEEAARDVARNLARGTQPIAVARRRAYFPTDDMAKIFVTMEVFGRPKALRPDEEF